MKVLILTNCYPPEIGAAANQLYELAGELVRRGDKVLVVTRFPRHIPDPLRPKQAGWFYREQREGVDIVRVNIPQLSRSVPLLREIEHLLNILLLFVAALLGGRTQVTLVYSPPIVVGYAAVLLRLFTGSKVVFNVQDLFPQSMIDLGLLKSRALIAASRFFEKVSYRIVDLITVHSEGNREIVVKTAGGRAKIAVVPNWVDTDYIVPGERQNSFRREFGLGDKFVVSFAGCMSDAQDMDIILNSAAALRDKPDLLFLLAGNGPKYESVKARASGLPNVKIIPIQPREKYVDLLAASDVALVTLNPQVATPVVPSKILSIMSAGRPLIAAFPPAGDAPRIIKAADCGLFVPAGDQTGFAEAIRTFYNDPELRRRCGERGRKYVVENFSLKACAALYERLFAGLIGQAARE